MDDEYRYFYPHWEYDWDRGWFYYIPDDVEYTCKLELDIPKVPRKAIFSEEARKDLEALNGIKL